MEEDMAYANMRARKKIIIIQRATCNAQKWRQKKKKKKSIVISNFLSHTFVS